MRVYTALVLTAISVCLPGCGESDAPGLTGSVTYNGAPVEDGYVTFAPVGAGTSIGAKIVNGQYTAEQVQPGQFTAMVQANRAGAAPKSREEAEKLAKAQAGKPQQSPNYIPQDAAGNGQTVEIISGDQTLDFALTGPPRQ